MSDGSGRLPLSAAGQLGAIDLIGNFLNSPDPQIVKLAALSGGGTFPIEAFELKSGFLAKQFWICFDDNSTDRKLFLAVEDSDKSWPRTMKPSEVPLTPQSETLLIPSSTFQISKIKPTDIEDFIRNATHKSTSDTINAKEVRKYAWAFAARFGENTSNYCEYPLAYFENYDPVDKVCYIDDFLKQGGTPNAIKYIKYFFGLDNTDKYGGNRIRVILAPADKDGKFIEKVPGTMPAVDTFLLQHSWPPPPPIQ